MDLDQEQPVRMEQYLVFLAQKISNKPLTVVGSGKQTRDFVHLTDLVHAIIKTARAK